ncbi:DNA-directed DNA polymerase [Entophlyctis luteolus]|nr:DNA-directed DNA polymerase [Entophlyctis luteolus]
MPHADADTHLDSDTHAPALAGARATGGLLQAYWDLAAPDALLRCRAAARLRASIQPAGGAAATVPARSTNHAASDDDADADADAATSPSAAVGPDAAYALRRLVRGLASSRDAARQGFTLALVEIIAQLLHTAPPSANSAAAAGVTVDLVVDLVEELHPVSNARGQEEREMYFARIFCMHAIVQSGLISALHTTPLQILRVTKVLLGCIAAKSYLAQASYSVLIDLCIANIKAHKDPESWGMRAVVEEVIKSGGMAYDGVWFVAAIQSEMEHAGYIFAWEPILKGTWEHPSRIISSSHAVRLGKILRESSITSPKLHPIFSVIIKQVLSGKNNSLPLADFWTHMVDEPFFNANTHDRKFVGFLIFTKTLEAALAAGENGADIDVAVLFSKPFLRCLINSLGKGEDAVLFKIAKETVECEWLLNALTIFAFNSHNEQAKQISTISSRKVALQVVFQLIGKNGHQRFDAVTRTKTVENLIGSLDEDETEQYITHLIDLVVTGGVKRCVLIRGILTLKHCVANCVCVSSTAESASAAMSTTTTTRMWAIDQLHGLVRAAGVPKREGWLRRVLRFLCAHSLFVVDRATAGVPACQPEMAPALREYCRARFLSALAELNAVSLEAAGGAGKLQPGVMENGEYWAYDLVQFVLELDGTSGIAGKKKGASAAIGAVRPANALEARSIEARNMAVKEISNFREKVKALSKDSASEASLIAQYKSFELLFLHVLLQVYTEPVDAVNILDELKSCADLVFSEATHTSAVVGKSKEAPNTVKDTRKRKAAEEENSDTEEESEGDGAPNPVDVILDILLSFLAKPSALFRGVVENVFRVFCPMLTASGIELIFDVLRAKGGVAGAAELFQNQDDDEDDDLEMIDAADVEDGDASDEGDSENDAEEVSGDDADDDDDDDDDDDENEDEDGESEFEDDEQDVDALKARLKAALGKHAISDAEEDDGDKGGSDDEEPLGDDDMEAFDEKLAAIFKERKRLKIEKRDAKQQVLHFKLRAVDLLEIFIKKQPANPIVLNIITPSLRLIYEISDSKESQELHTKLTGLVKTKLAHLKENPRINNVEDGVVLLKEIHDLATRAPSAAYVGLCSSMSLLVIKALMAQYPASLAQIQAHLPPPSKKKKGENAEQQVSDSKELLGPAMQVYAWSAENFMSKKKSKLHASLFLDLCNRYPALGLQLMPVFAEIIARKTVENGFKMVQGFNIMAACLQKLPAKDNESNAEGLEKFQRAFLQALVATTCAEGEEKGKKGALEQLGVQRTKEVVKAAASVVRRLRKTRVGGAGGEEMRAEAGRRMAGAASAGGAGGAGTALAGLAGLLAAAPETRN